jgi:hypothetical protein
MEVTVTMEAAAITDIDTGGADHKSEGAAFDCHGTWFAAPLSLPAGLALPGVFNVRCVGFTTLSV